MKTKFILFFILFIALFTSYAKPTPSTLTNYIEAAKSTMNQIPQERKEVISALADYINVQLKANKPVNLVFICTHNSRRSQMSQIWAKVAAEHYQLSSKINTYSGGTESTAFNPRAVQAMERAGLKIEKPVGTNPHYLVTFSDTVPAIECFSKIYSDAFNPQKNFIAVLNCSDADKNCPNVKGADFRTAIKYDDPKLADGTPEEQKTYDERCQQIATEMFYLMSRVNTK